MQPRTNLTIDRDSFERMKKTIRNMSRCNAGTAENSSFHTELPQEVGLQLTNKCNLRCKHCFEWSEKGYNHGTTLEKKNADLSIELIDRILRETESVKANLFLWGGEPLSYQYWDELTELIDRYQRWSVLCTNGIDIIAKMDSILKISDNLAILTSVEGFESENDIIRGKGSFAKALAGIEEVLRLQKAGDFKGKQSVHCTISDSMIPKLYDFMDYMEGLGVDTVYFCFPWYIPDHLAVKMDTFYDQKFDWLQEKKETGSWHSFGFRVQEVLIDQLIDQMAKINQRTWNIRVRYQPALELSEVRDYALGADLSAQNKKKCLAVTNRMDVLADGSVSACKLFSEFTVGNLYHQSLQEVWDGEKFNRIREALNNGLMPVCSKCILLYLNGF